MKSILPEQYEIEKQVNSRVDVFLSKYVIGKILRNSNFQKQKGFGHYIMLALENRETKDPKTLGNLFYFCCDELQDIRFEEAFQMILAILKKSLCKVLTIPESILKAFMDNFMASLPASPKGRLQLSICES